MELIITEGTVRHRIRGQAGDHISKVLKGTRGFYEVLMLRAIRDLNLSGIYMDVGAHIGNHAVFFGVHCPASMVIAIEPNAATYEVLRTNIQRAAQLHSDVVFEMRQEAAWRNSKDPLHVHAGPPGNSGMAYVEIAGKGPLVNSIALDDISVEDRVAVIKLDVEGAELPALQGAERLLQEDKPLLVIEARTPAELNQQRAFLSKFGYVPGTTQYNATPTYLWRYR